VTVSLRLEAGAIHAEVGPFRGRALGSELAHADAEDFGLRRVLDTVVDRVELGDREDGQWVRLVKRVATESGVT
jgi:nitric oxide synthase oxygenase domain/subunit